VNAIKQKSQQIAGAVGAGDDELDAVVAEERLTRLNASMTAQQKALIALLESHKLTIAEGAAGTGKTDTISKVVCQRLLSGRPRPMIVAGTQATSRHCGGVTMHFQFALSAVCHALVRKKYDGDRKKAERNWGPWFFVAADWELIKETPELKRLIAELAATFSEPDCLVIVDEAAFLDPVDFIMARRLVMIATGTTTSSLFNSAKVSSTCFERQ
jgi:hypothetical protein